MDAKKYPVAAKAGFGNKRSPNDMVTEKLAALHTSFQPPRPPAGSFDAAAATRGEALFKGKATCSQCHVPPLFTERGWNTHKASDISHRRLSG
jgi:mono/diheme cytochrome c family protein